jgi:hypothetical protein
MLTNKSLSSGAKIAVKTGRIQDQIDGGVVCIFFRNGILTQDIGFILFLDYRSDYFRSCI